jgi:hypothetical protein
MTEPTRRDFMKLAGAGAALDLPGATFAQEAKKASVPAKRAAGSASLRPSRAPVEVAFHGHPFGRGPLQMHHAGLAQQAMSLVGVPLVHYRASSAPAFLA